PGQPGCAGWRGNLVERGVQVGEHLGVLVEPLGVVEQLGEQRGAFDPVHDEVVAVGLVHEGDVHAVAAGVRHDLGLPGGVRAGVAAQHAAVAEVVDRGRTPPRQLGPPSSVGGHAASLGAGLRCRDCTLAGRGGAASEWWGAAGGGSVGAMTSEPTRPQVAASQGGTGFFGQPRGLANLFSVELWERFSFYGMQAIVLLYMYYEVADGGLGIDRAIAAGIVGAYGGSVYL